MRIDVFHHIEITHAARLDLQAILQDIANKLDALQKGMGTMTPELQALQQQVQRNNDVEESAIALLEGLAAQLQAAKEDPAAIQAIADQMSAESDRLAAAVTANTPVSTVSPTPTGAGMQPTAAGGTADAAPAAPAAPVTNTPSDTQQMPAGDGTGTGTRTGDVQP